MSVFAKIVTPRLSAFVIAGLAVIIVSKLKQFKDENI